MAILKPGNSVALKCLGHLEGPRFLDGRTHNGTVGLAPNTDPPFTGTRWLVVDGPVAGQVILKCLGHVEGPRFLDGRTHNGTVGLAPHTDSPFTGTRWEVINNVLKCLGHVEGPRFLDGRTHNGTVGLAPHTNPPFTGTHWEVVDFGRFPLPTELNFDTGRIVFGGGVPIGGSSRLTLRQDGTFSFSGHFHNSGAIEYNDSFVFGVKDLANRLYTFRHSGHVAGTFTSGSRDDDWLVDGRNDDIARNWTALAAGSKANWKANADADIVNLTNALIAVAGLVLGVVAIV